MMNVGSESPPLPAATNLVACPPSLGCFRQQGNTRAAARSLTSPLLTSPLPPYERMPRLVPVIGESGGEDLADDLGSIANGASRAGPILKPGQPLRIESFEPEANGALVEGEPLCDSGNPLPLDRKPDNLCALDEASRGRTRVGEALDLFEFLGGQGAKA